MSGEIMKKSPWKKRLILFVLICLIFNHYYRNITFNIEYAFCPECQLGSFYREYKDSQETAKTQDFSVIARTESYYQSLNSIIGDRNPGRGVFMASMNWYTPDEEYESLDLLKDHGDVIYRKESGLKPCKFVCLTGRYKKVDIRNHELTITSDGDADACVLGAVHAVYITPDKKMPSP